MEIFVLDKSDKILNDCNPHAVNALIMSEGSYCLAMKDEPSGEIAGFCFVTKEAGKKDALIIDSIEIEERFWKKEAEIFFIDEVVKKASKKGFSNLILKCDTSNLKSLRGKDAAYLAGFDFAYKKTYLEYSLFDLLKSELIKEFAADPESFFPVLIIQDRTFDLLDELKKDLKNTSIDFCTEDYDRDLTIFYPKENKISGICMAKPHSEGNVYIDGAYIDASKNKASVYMSMLAVCILQLSEYFMLDTKVRICFENDEYKEKIAPLLGKEPNFLNEEYYLKKIP